MLVYNKQLSFKMHGTNIKLIKELITVKHSCVHYTLYSGYTFWPSQLLYSTFYEFYMTALKMPILGRNIFSEYSI